MLDDRSNAQTFRVVARLAEVGEDDRAAFGRGAIVGRKRVLQRMPRRVERRQSAGNRPRHRRPQRHPIAEIRVLLEGVVPGGARHVREVLEVGTRPRPAGSPGDHVEDNRHHQRDAQADESAPRLLTKAPAPRRSRHEIARAGSAAARSNAVPVARERERKTIVSDPEIGQRRPASGPQSRGPDEGRHRAHAGAEHHDFERNGDKRRQRIPRLASDIDRPAHRRRPKLEDRSRTAPTDQEGSTPTAIGSGGHP